MKKFLMVLITIIFIMPIIVQASTDNTSQNVNYAKISFTTKYLGQDKNFPGSKILVNITINTLGHIVYMEYYYSIGSDGNPKLYNSRRFYDKEITSNKISFDILRPSAGGQKSYYLIKSVILFNNDIALEKWSSVSSSDKWMTDRLNNMTEPKKIIINNTNISDNITTTPNSTQYVSEIRNGTVNKTNTTRVVDKPKSSKIPSVPIIIEIIIVISMVIVIRNMKKIGK